MAKNKGILKTLAVGVLAVGVIGAGIGTAYHFKDNIKNWFDNIVNPEPTPTPTPGTNDDVNQSSGGVYVDGVKAGDNDVAYAMPKQITFTRYAKQATSDNTLTVTCNVLPTYAVNKKLAWSLVWQDGGNHGTVTDFVKMTVSSDTHSVTIQALKAFTYKIKLVVKTTDGSNLSKDCILDYLCREYSYNHPDFGTITPETNIINFVNLVKQKVSVDLSGGTIKGDVVIDDVAIVYTGTEFTSLYSKNDFGYNDFTCNSSSTFYDFYLNQNGADGMYSSAEEFMSIINGNTADVHVTFHVVYNGKAYLSTSDLWETQDCYVGNVRLNNDSRLKVSSLSFNDTSFIF